MLHHEEGEVVLLPDIVKRADVGMTHPRDGPRFTLEALQPPRIGRGRRGEDLDRDEPIEPRVARAIDLAHRAGSQRRQDLVGSESCAGMDGHPVTRSGRLHDGAKNVDAGQGETRILAHVRSRLYGLRLARGP